jgi:hypothetical protein
MFNSTEKNGVKNVKIDRKKGFNYLEHKMSMEKKIF